MNYIYILRCADGSLYCGWTNRLDERVKAHNSGKGAKYTKGRRPVVLAYFEEYDTKEEAMKREAAIKKLSKTEKESLIKETGGAPVKTPGRISVKPPEGASVEISGRAPVKTSGKVSGEIPARSAGDFKIIISPAKKMQVKNDDLPWKGLPVFLDQAEELLHKLKTYTEPELKALFRANDSITHENYLRYRSMDLQKNLTPALLSYVGIQYQYMAPHIFSEGQWEYVCRHLRILSGFYGILRADDGIVPYRLEMQAKLKTEKGADLYRFWGEQIYGALAEEQTGCRILNLASVEYSRAVEPYVRPQDEFVTCVFGTEAAGNVKVKATEAKMARGEMVRYLAERAADDFETVKEFTGLGFHYCPELSTEKKYIFIK